MCQLAGSGAVSFPEASALDDTGGTGLMAGPRVRGLRSSCSASDKAALMPMIPQRGAEEPFDGTLEAIDAAIDAELEEEHHAVPLRHKKKVGRPLKYQGDPNSPHLTAEERRRLKRRQANRESARRVRQKRVETFGQLQVRMRALQESTHELQGRLDTALAEKAAMHRQWLELRRQLAECTAQNSRLEADTLPCKRMTVGMRPERVPEYAALGGGGGAGGRLMGGSPSPSIGEVSGEGDSSGVAVGGGGHHGGHHGARGSGRACGSPVGDGRFCHPGQSRPMIARTSGSGTWLRAVTTGDPVSTDPWALAGTRTGGYDCGAAAPRTGCTVTTAYATAPGGNAVSCDPHAAPGSPVLVFSPFAARNAPNHAHNNNHNNAALVSNNANIETAVAMRAASVAAPSYPADRDSLTSDRSAFDARRGGDAAADHSGLQEAASEHMGSLRESLDWLLGQEEMDDMVDEMLPGLGADSSLKPDRGTVGGFGAARC